MTLSSLLLRLTPNNTNNNLRRENIISPLDQRVRSVITSPN